MIRELPFYKSFPAEDETDEWFQRLTDEQRGYYWRLKNHFWTNGSIPADSSRRCSLFRIHHKTEQGCFKDLARMFHEDPKDPSRLIHGPLQEQLMECSRKSISASNSAKARYERSTAEDEYASIRARVLDQEEEKETPLPPDGGGKSPDGTPTPDHPSVVRPPAPAKTEAALYAENCIATAAAAIHARHPAGPRRDISANAVAKALAKIVRYKQATIRQVPEVVAEINRVHETWCATEDWRKDGGTYAKGLKNWLCPSEGRYETAAVVPIRPAIKPTVYFDDSYLTKVEEA